MQADAHDPGMRRILSEIIMMLLWGGGGGISLEQAPSLAETLLHNDCHKAWHEHCSNNPRLPGSMQARRSRPADVVQV